MIAGVNGAGKTTSIGKLAQTISRGREIRCCSPRATPSAPRRASSSRPGASATTSTVISQQGGDPAAVIFDAIQAARARDIDVVLADTAGRLPTQLHLMEEVRKVKRVIAKADASAPHEVLLVLDANTGQNALSQVKAFDEALGLTGLILTKLDGTAKGGVVAAIAEDAARSRYASSASARAWTTCGRSWRRTSPHALDRTDARRPLRAPGDDQLQPGLASVIAAATRRCTNSASHRAGRNGVHHRTLRRGQEHRCSS